MESCNPNVCCIQWIQCSYCCTITSKSPSSSLTANANAKAFLHSGPICFSVWYAFHRISGIPSTLTAWSLLLSLLIASFASFKNAVMDSAPCRIRSTACVSSTGRPSSRVKQWYTNEPSRRPCLPWPLSCRCCIRVDDALDSCTMGYSQAAYSKCGEESDSFDRSTRRSSSLARDKTFKPRWYNMVRDDDDDDEEEALSGGTNHAVKSPQTASTRLESTKICMARGAPGARNRASISCPRRSRDTLVRRAAATRASYAARCRAASMRKWFSCATKRMARNNRSGSSKSVTNEDRAPRGVAMIPHCKSINPCSVQSSTWLVCKL